jgi:hypothetical protein
MRVGCYKGALPGDAQHRLTPLRAGGPKKPYLLCMQFRVWLIH